MTSLASTINNNLTVDSGKTARLNCRVRASIKERAEEAAGILGQSITDFTEQALVEKSEAVFHHAERLQLSERAFEQFLQAINEPGEPTSALQQAAEAYKQLREHEPAGNW
ncbi:MAG: DUF1778 domain-containing protein [Armatimonadota bacterium]|nr:DUF1778 domain-containing protein [Armatimonadota bacterium]